LCPLYTLSKAYYLHKLRDEMENQSHLQRISQTYNQSKDKWALVTGGSEGIGKSFAQDLAKSGFNILLVSRSEEKLEKAKE
jgi:NADPH:quinone reductase-like Zn-dependent oxidoreductase